MKTRFLDALIMALFLLAAGLFAGSASAVLPDSGLYYNPSESGRGLNMEIQNNVLFIAVHQVDAPYIDTLRELESALQVVRDQ